MKKLWTLAAVVLLSLFSNELLLAKKKDPSKRSGAEYFTAGRVGLGLFKFSKVEGKVVYWYPLSSQWRPLKAGMALPIGTIIQIIEPGALKFRYSGQMESNLPSDQIYVDIKTEMSFTLNQDFLRDVSSDEMFLSRIPVVKEFDRKEKFPEYWTDLKQAWNMVKLRIIPDENNRDYVDNIFKKSEIQPVEIAAKHKKIKVLYPTNGSFEKVDSYPTKLPIIWKRPKGYKGPYKLYLWKHGDYRPEPLDRVRGSRYDALISEPGSYYIQVAGANNRYLSAAVLVNMGEPLQERPEAIGYDELLTASFPKDGMVFATPIRKHRPVRFEWDAKEQFDFDTVELIIIPDRPQRPLKEGEEERPEDKDPRFTPGALITKFHKSVKAADIRLKPGKYIWYLESELSYVAGNQKTTKQLYLTTPRKVRVLRSKEILDLAMIQRALNKRPLKKTEGKPPPLVVYLD